MENQAGSVRMIPENCVGCNDCIKRCPTQAIRVRNGRAFVIPERCVDCGMCVKVCKNGAKAAATQDLSIIGGYKYKIAVPAPSLYGQFRGIYDVNVILTALKALGFDEVIEVAAAAETVSRFSAKLIKNDPPAKPLISSACPVVVKLIAMRFPDLVRNILPVISPAEAAAVMAREHFVKLGHKKEEIGVFFISPCAAKHSDAFAPFGVTGSSVDGVIAIADIYSALLNKIHAMDASDLETLALCTEKGVFWAISGGECDGLGLNAIAADGIENVINVLEDVENGRLDETDFIECLCCAGGCIGGPLNVVSSFVARSNLNVLEKSMVRYERRYISELELDPSVIELKLGSVAKAEPLALDADVSYALLKLEKMNEIISGLPGIDCGACGSPTCAALAEDVVKGEAEAGDCVFMLKNRVKRLALEVSELASKSPGAEGR